MYCKGLDFWVWGLRVLDLWFRALGSGLTGVTKGLSGHGQDCNFVVVLEWDITGRRNPEPCTVTPNLTPPGSKEERDITATTNPQLPPLPVP